MVVHSWFRTVLARRYHSSGLFSCKTRRFWNGRDLMTRSFPFINDAQTPVTLGLSQDSTLSLISSTVWRSPGTVGFCGLAKGDSALPVLDSDEDISEDVVVDALPCNDSRELKEHFNEVNTPAGKRKAKIDADLLPTVILVGRPDVGKSALFNRFIQRREALVYNTPDDHVTRDIREGIAKLGDLRFRVLDSAGLETTATSGSILDKTTGMTGHVLARSQFAMFLIDVRDGLQPLDFEVGSWLRKHACWRSYKLGYGDPIAISAETGLGMGDLYDSLRPLLEEYMLHVLNEKASQSNDSSSEVDESKLPLQLAIVGRPNVGKSTILNALLQQERVLVGPEAGLTRDSVRAEFQYEGRTVYLVDTAGWLQRSKQEKGPGSLSVMQSRKNLMRAHVIALVLDADERRAVEEGRGLVVIVNKMDLLRGKENAKLYEKVIKAVPEEIQAVIPQITGIPVVFVSALEGKGRIAIMCQVMETYEKWCLRLSTARLNRWLCKVMSRHSWKDQKAKPKIKYFTQVKARPPTFVALIRGKTEFSDTDIRFLTRSLKEDFDLGEFLSELCNKSCGRMTDKIISDKRTVSPDKISSDKRTEDSPNTNHLGVTCIAPC
ncbi:hypothetical protein MKW92_037238 [Papaver armeniacum]|nr:hypothetical protein MKW92_037238 [Papaver armeniacum]